MSEFDLFDNYYCKRRFQIVKRKYEVNISSV